MINSKNISVVVQGTIIKEFTKHVLLSIRQTFPEAEIILSTWKDTDVKDLDYDIMVENDDPVATPPPFNSTLQLNQKYNLNRQIVSTKNGIRKATRKYILKTRTDIIYNNANFLNYFGKFKLRNENCKILKERVLICQHYVKRPELFPFHISDCVMFGLKEDIEQIWDIELEPEPEYTEWFYHHNLLPQHRDKKHEYNFFRHRYCAEQYIWSKFLLKNGIQFEFNHMFDISWDNSYLTKLSFANNLVILSLEQYGITFCNGNPLIESNIYTFYDWKKLYKTYCDKNFVVENQPIDYDEIFGTKKYRIEINKLKAKFGKKNIIYDFGYIFKIIILYLRLEYKTIRKSYKLLLKKTTMFNSLDNYIATFPKNINQINILETSLGETLIFAKIMEYLIKNKSEYNNFAHLLFKQKQDVFHFYSNFNIKYLEAGRIHLKDNTYYYKNKTLKFFFGEEFWHSLFASKEHFLDAFQKELNIDLSKIDMTTEPRISENVKKSALEKAKEIKLNLNKFIFISPEASSMDQIPKEFWEMITNSYLEQGYDVFNNITDFNNCIKNSKTCDLTIEEAYVIASHAKKIIGLRSGFLELFLTLDVPMDVIYNMNKNSKNRFLVNIFENYTLQKYPKNPKLIINEYKYQIENDLKVLVENVLK